MSKAENAEQFLCKFRSWLHADGYQGYHNLSDRIRIVGCHAHARRKFDEVLNAFLAEARKGSKAAEGVAFFTRLSQMENAFAKLTPEQRYTQRLEHEKPVLAALWAWSNALMQKTAPKSALGRALYYLTELWLYLVRYLEDGRLKITNNRAKRSIKPFVMGRKNFLFANTLPVHNRARSSTASLKPQKRTVGIRTAICFGFSIPLPSGNRKMRIGQKHCYRALLHRNARPDNNTIYSSRLGSNEPGLFVRNQLTLTT